MESSFGVKIDEYLPLRDVVFYTLRQAILRGELKPGERLLEIRLANKLGVSRTPVREAIRKLELEGLVKMVPRRGAEVAEITEKRVRDALEVRRALEELAVQLNSTFDTTERNQIAIEMQQQLLDDNAFVFCSFLKMSMISQANVTGLTAHASDYYELTADLDIN